MLKHSVEISNVVPANDPTTWRNSRDRGMELLGSRHGRVCYSSLSLGTSYGMTHDEGRVDLHAVHGPEKRSSQLLLRPCQIRGPAGLVMHVFLCEQCVVMAKDAVQERQVT